MEQSTTFFASLSTRFVLIIKLTVVSNFTAVWSFNEKLGRVGKGISFLTVSTLPLSQLSSEKTSTTGHNRKEGRWKFPWKLVRFIRNHSSLARSLHLK